MSRKTPHILVLIQDYQHIHKATTHAFKLATIFKAEVAFASLTKETEELDPEMIDRCNPNKIPYKEYQFGNLSVEPNNCIKQLDAIFIVTEFAIGKTRKLSTQHPIFKFLNRAKIPSIVVSEYTIENCDYRNIIVPVDNRKESKEKMIWASYFGRFNQAEIHLLVANEKNTSLQQRIKANLLFTKKMYEPFKFEYRIVKAKSNSSGLRDEAYQFSKQYHSDLLVLLAKKKSDWLGYYFVMREIKKLLTQEKNPILLINPLKDYYLPCD